MRILINTSNLNRGGGLQVAHSFLYSLESFKYHEFHVILSSSMNEIIDRSSFSSNFHFYVYTLTPNFFNALTGFDMYLNRMEKLIKPTRVFSVFGPTYWKPKSVHIVGYAKPQYIDMGSPFFKQISKVQLVRLKILKFFHLHNFSNYSDVLIAETRFVSDSLKSLFPKKRIYTVSNTFNQIFDHPEVWDKQIQLPSFNGVSLLTISANYPHKNLRIIPKVIEYFRNHKPDFKLRFVLTIDESELSDIDSSIGENILFLGKVDVTQCPHLYTQVDFMFLPTLLECFSASYPEAMKMEIPILTSDLPFAHDICGAAAYYFNPLDPEDIVNKIVEISYNREKQIELINYGVLRLQRFDTVNERAMKYIDIIEKS